MTSSWSHGQARLPSSGPGFWHPSQAFPTLLSGPGPLLLRDEDINWEEESFDSLPAIIIIIAVIVAVIFNSCKPLIKGTNKALLCQFYSWAQGTPATSSPSHSSEVPELGFRLRLAPEPICHMPKTFQDQLASWARPPKAHSTARLSFGEGWC